MQTNTETRASLITQASALLLERPFTREASAKFDRLMILADAMDIQVDEFRKAQSGAVQAELRSESEKAFRRYIRTGSEVEELRTYSPMGTTSTAAFLAEQWKAASMGTVLNLAESTARMTHPEKKHYLTIARGNINTCVALLEVAKEFGWVSPTISEQFYAKYEQMSKMMLGMIRSFTEK